MEPTTCKHCGCTGIDDDGGQLHWDSPGSICPLLDEDHEDLGEDDADFSGASDTPGYAPDR